MKISIRLVLLLCIASVLAICLLALRTEKAVSTRFNGVRVLWSRSFYSDASAIQFSLDGKRLVVIGSVGKGICGQYTDGFFIEPGVSDTHLRVWNVGRNYQERKLMSQANSLAFLTFLPDRKTFLKRWSGRTLKLVDVYQHHPDKTFDIGNGGVGNAVVSPDQKLLVIGKGCEVQIRDARTLRLLRTFRHAAYWTRVSFGDDSRIVRCQWDTSKDQYIDLETAKRVAKPQSTRAFDVTFAPDKKHFALVKNRNFVELWKRVEGKSHRIETFKSHLISIQTLEFSPDGKTLAVGGISSTTTPVQFFDVP